MNPQLQLMLQQAIQAFQELNFDDAEKKLRYFLKIIPKSFDAIHLLAIVSASQGKHEEAITYYKRALELNKKTPSVLNNLGSSLNALGKNSEALLAFKGSLKIDPAVPETWYNAGNTLCDLERYEEAIIYYERSVEINPEYYQALNNLGLALFKLNRHSESLIYFDRAYLLNEYFLDCLINKGEALKELKRYEESLACNQRVLAMNPEYAEAWSNKGITLNDLKRHDEAIAHYDKALSLKPDYAVAWSNKGVTLNDLKRHDEAIAHFDKALSLKLDYAVAWSNKGVTLNDLKRYDEAIAHYDKALSLKPDYAEAWSNKGVTLNDLKRYDEAIAHFDKALSLKPDIDWVSGDLLHIKMKICSWSGLAEALEDISKKVVANERVTYPFPLLALNDDALLHKKSSEIYIQSKYPLNPILGPIPKRPNSHKIRVGYFSADFRQHAVSILAAELFELHDKTRFETIAFSFGVDDKSPMRFRLNKAFSQFIDVSDMSDLEIAKLARELQIDIAIDLGGFTSDGRTGLFAYRAAPVQVSYLGYLGTMGAEYIDYIHADKTTIPDGSEYFYTEKIAYLPSYRVNDRKRIISDKVFTKQELGLPEKGFVFCCFNSNYKILPSTFDSWMRILHAVEGSVLFLFADNKWAEENLKKEAGARGINIARLVFGKSLPADEYLARYRACDLFLDTAPYNAGTTASDALWTGLPVLTRMGQSFASRVAASLLNAIGLPELITSTQEEYELLAIELAKNSKKLANLKLQLSNNRLSAPLFNAPLFAKNLEEIYIKMHERYQSDLQPDHLFIV
jgi:predicted O-linked N-acetylglucosamine transferase (SPINDLY family)